MARKRKVFQYVRDDQDAVADEPAERPDRKAARQESRELAALANRVAELPAGMFAALSIEPDLREELVTLRTSGLDSGRKRQLKRTVSALRASDVDALLRELDGRGEAVVRLHGIERWRVRILAEGDAAIQDFIETHDGVDRGQLRALARQARGEGDAAARAARRLFSALKGAVERAPTGDEE